MKDPYMTTNPPPRNRRLKRRRFLEALMNAGEDNNVQMVDVGKRLRDLRRSRGLSLRALAEKSQLNVNTLSMIENGKTSPSVATLQQLAFSLGCPITAFFEVSGTDKKIAYQKGSQRRKAPFKQGTLEDLSGGIASRGAEYFLVTLEPQADSGEAKIVHTGHEFVFCLDGRLSYTIDEETIILEAGDSLLFEAHLPHRWKNIGNTQSQSLLALCPSDENDRPTERHFL